MKLKTTLTTLLAVASLALVSVANADDASFDQAAPVRTTWVCHVGLKEFGTVRIVAGHTTKEAEAACREQVPQCRGEQACEASDRPDAMLP